MGNLRPLGFFPRTIPSAILVTAEPPLAGEAGGNTNGAVCPATRLRLPKGTRVEARSEAESGFFQSRSPPMEKMYCNVHLFFFKMNYICFCFLFHVILVLFFFVNFHARDSCEGVHADCSNLQRKNRFLSFLNSFLVYVIQLSFVYIGIRFRYDHVSHLSTWKLL